MSAILKRAFSAIARRWKTLAWILAAILLAFFIAVLRRLPELFVLAATSVFLIFILWLFPKWQVRSIANPDLKPEERFDRENEARKTLSQILGGLVLLIGFYFIWQILGTTQENLRIASESQITDRFSKAIAQLGDPKLELRLGAIYSLERIAKDSAKDHWPIMEVLTAYVREHAKRNPSGEPLPKTQATSPRPPPDIQAILTVIGRRTLTDREPWLIDLHNTDLRGADLFRAYLNGANLSNTDLRDADAGEANLGSASLRGAALNPADFSGANLDRAYLSGANLSHASLRGASLRLAELGYFDPTYAGEEFRPAILAAADFSAANLTHAYLSGTILSGANLTAAHLPEADLRRTDLREATGLVPAQLELAKGDADTKLPPNIPRPKSWH